MPVAPPRPKMPPLNALRAFEAAARLNSISAAAEELRVTPAAVAQQVKSLEGWTGEKLFTRNARGVDLTPLGASVLSDFSLAFDTLGAAVQKLRVKSAPLEIRIAALPSLAQLWVSPRLPRIRKLMPNASISVSALEKPPCLIREPFDLAIFYRDQVDADNTVVVAQDVIFPVCTPVVAERLNTIEDLSREIFLHDSTWQDDWKIWLANVAPDTHLNKNGPEFSLYSLALEECKNGAGILIGHETLVRPQLEAGRLVAPFNAEVVLPTSLTVTLINSLEAGSVLSEIVEMLVAGDTGGS